MALLSLSDQEFHRVEQTWRRWGHLWFLVCILSLFLPVYISNLVENATSTAKCQDKGKCLERLPGASAGRAHGEHCQENIEEVCSHLHGPPPLKWTVLVHQKDWTMGPSTGRTHSLLKTPTVVVKKGMESPEKAGAVRTMLSTPRVPLYPPEAQDVPTILLMCELCPEMGASWEGCLERVQKLIIFSLPGRQV